MKKYIHGLLLMGLITLIGSCKKSENSIANNTGSSVKPGHGLGAILDVAEYQKIPKADFGKIQEYMIKNGYGSKLSINTLTTQSLPTSLILNHPTPGDQGQTGTCVSWSVGYALRGTLNNEFFNGVSPNPRSPWFIYQIDHSQRGDNSTQDGMVVSNGMYILRGNGVPAESLDASLGNPATYPSTTVDADAAKDVVTSYNAISTVADIKTAISMDLPVEMGFNDYTSFDNAYDSGTIYKTFGGTLRGGHAICIVGYDDTKNAVLAQNSWGDILGDPANPGCIWIDYGLLTNANLGIQLYVATPPPVININGASSITWSQTTSGQGTISAPPGTLVHVTVSAYGQSGANYETECFISGAQVTSPMGSGMIAYDDVSITGTFTMPSSGSVTWSGGFTKSNVNYSGTGSIGVY
jgi:hypothetical protein